MQRPAAHASGTSSPEISPVHCTVDGLLDQLKPGITVFVGSASAAPTPFVEALRRAPACARGVTFVGAWVPGIDDFDPCALHPKARAIGLFPPRSGAGLVDGRYRLANTSYHGFSNLLSGETIDLAVLQTGAPLADGRLPMTNADYSDVLVGGSCQIAVLFNPRHCHGPDAFALPRGRIAYWLDDPVGSTPTPRQRDSATDDKIAHHVAGLVRDGDTIQIGIGTIQAAILSRLKGHRDLGIHSGLLNDPMANLIRRGIVTNARKPRNTGASICTAAVGSDALYRDLGALGIVTRPAAYTHDAQVLASLDRFTAINSALEVDLLGRVNATHLGQRRVSAPGGYRDFTTGAHNASQGQAIIALPSTSRGNTRIVRALSCGDQTTGDIQDAGIVITEHGIADLRNMPLAARLQAMIAIAAPEHRETLLRQSHADGD